MECIVSVWLPCPTNSCMWNALNEGTYIMNAGMHEFTSSDNRPVPTDSNSRAYLGRDSERDPNKRDYFYFYVWGQKSRDY